MTRYPLEQNPFFQRLLPEVHNVANDMPEFKGEGITDDEAKAVTQRICEERNEDSMDFWLFLSDIEALDDDDDWSDANGCIENLIRKVLIQETAAAI